MTQTFRNRAAAFLWGFTAVWIGMLVAFTYLFVRDGSPDGSFVMPVVLVFFWCAGLGLLVFSLSQPCLFIDVNTNGVVATWRYPHRMERRTLPRADVAAAEVVESKDSDGDPYFTARAICQDGKALNFSEGQSREACQEECDAFNRALFGRGMVR